MKEKIKENFFLLISIPALLFISVTFAAAANYKSFLVERVFGYDKLLITDGFSQYIISYGFGCSSFDFSEGQTIWIDTYFSPSLFNTILVKGVFDTKTCDITDSKEVNLKQYFVVSVIDKKDESIVEDKYGDKYLVEYGIGCGLSMWRYEGKYIDIDIGGSFLDGISDRIYLFDSDKDCKVWDAQELSSDQWGGSPLYTPQCPANSTLIGNTCVCNEGFVASGSICITYTQNCQLKYGLNSYGDKNYCYCSPGYEFNSEKTACIKSIICPSNSTKINNICVCNEGYIMRDNICITYTEDCIKSFGPNVYGIKGPNNNSSCYCNSGYEWNSSQTACVKIQEKKQTPLIKEEKQSQEKQQDQQVQKSQQKEKELVMEEEKEELREVKIEGDQIESKTERTEPKEKRFFSAISIFLASIYDTIKNFFSKIFIKF
ncbi:MAG: EB domain-containing protein [Candidatus Omnitrophica bacterium]|nr:EB domain-containing protein [Candidatus Omnitrophota bacterium]